MYAIMGATGHTGSVIVEQLLAGGAKVRAIGHNPQHLTGLTGKGAEGVVANATDAAALTKAFEGANAVYLLLPPDMAAPDYRAYQDSVTDAIVAAVSASRPAYAVVLSSEGADKPEKTGPVVGLHKLEEKLRAISDLNTLFLRAGYFMENTLAQIGVIKSQNMLAGPLRAELPVDMIATRDIGHAAAQALTRLDFKGKSSRELHGLRDVSYQELAKIVGAAIGKPDLKYRQAPAMILKPALMSMGMSASMADLLLEMCDALNSGYMKPLEARTPQSTGITTIETFVAEVFVPLYRAQTGGAGAARA